MKLRIEPGFVPESDWTKFHGMKKLPVLAAVLLLTLPLSAQDDYLELEKDSYRTIPYRLLRPEEEKGNQKYPLVLFLHGSGECGTDNIINLRFITPLFMKAESRTKYPCYLLIPQCPTDSGWAGKDDHGPGDIVMDLNDSLSKKANIDTRRIYVTGLSMGGYGTWYLLAKYPGKFAAAAPICGGGDPAKASVMRNIPVWVFHGADDPVVSVEESRRMTAAIREAGGKPKYTEYQGVGHNSWVNAYAEPELMRWLFSFKLKL